MPKADSSDDVSGKDLSGTMEESLHLGHLQKVDSRDQPIQKSKFILSAQHVGPNYTIKGMLMGKNLGWTSNQDTEWTARSY